MVAVHSQALCHMRKLTLLSMIVAAVVIFAATYDQSALSLGLASLAFLLALCIW